MPGERVNRDLVLPYFLPYLTYTGVATLASGSLAREWDYALRIGLTALAMIWAWQHYVPLRGPGSPALSVLSGLVAGMIGLALWLGLLSPFVQPSGDAWAPSAIGLRIAAACTLVPVFEELAMRGFVHRFVVQWQRNRAARAASPFGQTLDRDSISELAPGAWTTTAVVVSAVVFALAHQSGEWLAALVYGAWMSALWILRKDLLSCVVAHAVTNLALAVYVIQTGRWEFW